MSLQLNISSLLQAARKKDRDEHASGESAKLGTLRAGTTGLLTEEGDVAGQCHRKAHLRSLGLEIDPPTPDRLIMFELGFANETVILDQLKQVMPKGHTILVEEEIPISWQTSNGTIVSGRPDLVFCKSEYSFSDEMPEPHPLTTWMGGGQAHKYAIEKKVPVLGIELKSVHSMWTVREVLFNRSPKLDHMVQSAHYMWKLGIPYKLIYKSYSQLGQGMAGGKDSWVSKQFPRSGAAMSEFVEYNKQGNIKHIRQFEVVYDLRIDRHGRVQYKLESETDSQWTNTIVTTQDIERYFEFVSKMGSEQKLGPRPMTLGIDGSEANYSSCSYCPLNNTCALAEKNKWGYSEWLEEVKKEIVK